MFHAEELSFFKPRDIADILPGLALPSSLKVTKTIFVPQSWEEGVLATSGASESLVKQHVLG